MSKSTKRYGNVTMSAKTTIDANPTTPPHILRQWEELDAIALEKYNFKYYLLTEEQKSAVVEIHKLRKKGNIQQADHEELCEVG